MYVFIRRVGSYASGTYLYVVYAFIMRCIRVYTSCRYLYVGCELMPRIRIYASCMFFLRHVRVSYTPCTCLLYVVYVIDSHVHIVVPCLH